MTAKKKLTAKAAIEPKTDEEIAILLTSPSVQAARTMQRWQGAGAEINALVEVLSSQIDKVYDGDMRRPEAMLLAQAHTLDELFNTLARRAHERETVSSCETHLRLALKAQSQCRSTLEALAAIKNPPVIFAKQANISNGHQQINNGAPTPATHTEEIKNQPNELLEHTDGERLDTRATGKTIGVNSELEAVA